MDFAAIVADIRLALRTAGGLDAALTTGAFGDTTTETVDAVLDEAARFAGEVLAPLNRTGDRAGVAFDSGRVTMAPGYREAYRRWADAGWAGLGASTQWDGQGMPVAVQIAVQEIWNAANPSFALGAMLTASAVEALAAHGDDALRAALIPHLVAGEWTGTMNLTEPQAGSDLGAIATRATRAAEGSYRIFGTKVFITYGEHDLTDNIVHMVLARLTDAPAGTGGISMFAVPKVLRDGTPNDVVATGVEDKLGLHAVPTCTMVYGEKGQGAVAWRVGEENKGLAAMFTMMNQARLAVGVQGVGVAAAATARALAYARERRQGRAAGSGDGGTVPILAHPDVRRMLLAMRSLTAAARAICHATAHAIDMSHAASQSERAGWGHRAALLTPLAKAFPTDAAIDVANLGIQVHGGAGYIEETGAAQALRDARVFAIYEGTNGIQAIDLVTRKLALDGGRTIAALVSDIRTSANRVQAINTPAFGATADRLMAAAEHLSGATSVVADALREGRINDGLAAATPYLRLTALAFGGALLADAAVAAGEGGNAATLTARFFAETYLGETANLAMVVQSGEYTLREFGDMAVSGRD